MIIREDLKDFVVEALRAHNKRASIVEICKYVWDNHEAELRSSGDLFYTWQYEIRWAGYELRKTGTLLSAGRQQKGMWELV